MSDIKLFIPIILGTDREGRQSEKVAKYLLQKINDHPEIKTTLFDVRTVLMPMNDYGEDLKDENPSYEDLIVRSDGIIIVAPEYNHGYPGVLKSTLDLLLKEYNHKSVGLVGVSSGPFGGARVIEQLVNVVRRLGLIVHRDDLHFPNVQDLFDDNGNLLDDSFNERTDKFLDEIVWMTKTLKWGRENL